MMTLNSLSGLLKILAISVQFADKFLNDLTFQIYIVFYNGGLQQQVFKNIFKIYILSVDRFLNVCIIYVFKY